MYKILCPLKGRNPISCWLSDTCFILATHCTQSHPTEVPLKTNAELHLADLVQEYLLHGGHCHSDHSWAATHIRVLKHILSHWDVLDHRNPTANWAIVPSCAQLCGWLLYGILRNKRSQLCCKTNLSTSQPKGYDRDPSVNTDLQKVIHKTLQCCTAYSTGENHVGCSWICLNRCWNLRKIREVNRNKNPQSILLELWKLSQQERRCYSSLRLQ